MKTSYILFSGIDDQGRNDIATFDDKQDVISTGLKMSHYACRRIFKQHPHYYINLKFDKLDNQYNFNLYNQNGKDLDDKYQLFLSFEPVVRSPVDDKLIKKLVDKYLYLPNYPWLP